MMDARQNFCLGKRNYYIQQSFPKGYNRKVFISKIFRLRRASNPTDTKTVNEITANLILL